MRTTLTNASAATALAASLIAPMVILSVSDWPRPYSLGAAADETGVVRGGTSLPAERVRPKARTQAPGGIAVSRADTGARKRGPMANMPVRARTGRPRARLRPGPGRSDTPPGPPPPPPSPISPGPGPGETPSSPMPPPPPPPPPTGPQPTPPVSPLVPPPPLPPAPLSLPLPPAPPGPPLPAIPPPVVPGTPSAP
jgi:hypothetical protein